MRTTQQVNVIFIGSYRLHFNLIALLNPNCRVLDYLGYLIIQQRFPVFHWKHNMIVNLPSAVVTLPHFLFLAFITHLEKLTKSRKNSIPVASYGEFQVKKFCSTFSKVGRRRRFQT